MHFGASLSAREALFTPVNSFAGAFINVHFKRRIFSSLITFLVDALLLPAQRIEGLNSHDEENSYSPAFFTPLNSAPPTHHPPTTILRLFELDADSLVEKCLSLGPGTLASLRTLRPTSGGTSMHTQNVRLLADFCMFCVSVKL